jgi:hypothetical protein
MQNSQALGEHALRDASLLAHITNTLSQCEILRSRYHSRSSLKDFSHPERNFTPRKLDFWIVD